MTLTRVTTYRQHQTLLNNSSSVMQQLSRLQDQISSGQKASTFADLDRAVADFTDLENKLNNTDRFIEHNNVAISRLNTTSATLDKVTEITDSFKSLLLLRRSATNGSNLAFQEQVQSTWKALAGQLNISFEGRFLFSGSRTDAPPVDDTTFPILQTPEVPDNTYYLGGSQDLTLRAQENFEMTYNVRADDPAFQDIVAAIATAAEGGETGDDAKFKKAYELLESGAQKLSAVKATVSSNRITLEQINERHDSLKLYWRGLKEQIANTDVVSASTEVAVNQGILQASFQVFARLSALRLSDFLR